MNRTEPAAIHPRLQHLADTLQSWRLQLATADELFATALTLTFPGSVQRTGTLAGLEAMLRSAKPSPAAMATTATTGTPRRSALAAPTPGTVEQWHPAAVLTPPADPASLATATPAPGPGTGATHLLVITDDLPDGDITAALHAVAELLPPERRRLLVVLDDDCSREALQACLDVQVAGLCRASAVGTGQVLSTMAAIAHGGVSIDPWFLQRLQQPRHQQRSSPLVWDADELSGRERQLLRLISEGYDSREISDQVGISQYAVRRCLSQAYQRIGVRDRAQAIGWSVAHGVISARDLRRIYRPSGPC